jgi:hypothetical protein
MGNNKSPTKICQADHKTFSGLIYLCDFNTNHKGKKNANGSEIASRIIADRKFDIQCRRNRSLQSNCEQGGM